MPTVNPPPRFAPFADASMTPFSPPHRRMASARAMRNPTSSARAIEAAARVQPLVEDVKVRIDRKRLRLRGPYRYGILTEDLLRVDVTVRVGRSRAVGVLRYVPKLDYPLMYLKDIR